ncbi:MAG: substrate-binding domain-containing protein [Lachnospiraceae bacterium]|nr:substrate-binding domain-containing protein [Lachnospiraceae bacterium]
MINLLKRLSYIFILLLFVPAAFSLSGCSGAGTASGTDDAPPLSEFEPITEIKDGRKNIYLIIKVVDSSYWQVIVKGVREAGIENDCNVYCGGTTIETDWQGQRKLINEAIDRRADAILLSPDDSVELAPDIEKVHDLGVPIVLIDTAANTESYAKCYMTDNLLAGQKAASEMIKQLKMAGYLSDRELKVGIMVGSAASQTINERLAGFYKCWTDNAPRKWSIIPDLMNCDGKIDEGIDIAEDFLKEHTDVCGLYSTNNSPTRAICSVVKDQERKDLVVVGFDYSDEIKELIEAPEYHASTMLQRQYDMGWRSVETAMQILGGNEPAVKFEDTGVVTVNYMNISDPEVMEVLKNN